MNDTDVAQEIELEEDKGDQILQSSREDYAQLDEADRINTLLKEREQRDDEAFRKGEISFEAAKPNSDFLPSQPYVSPKDPFGLNELSLANSRKDDMLICSGLSQELRENNLMPNGETFYLIDFGLPHLPSLQSRLLDHGIDSSIYTQPNEERLNESPGHFQRYCCEYRHHRKDIFKKRKSLKKPKGFALLVNSHAEKDEKQALSKILPDLQSLKQKGIRKIVMGIETFFHYGKPDVSSWEAGYLAEYLRKADQLGMKVDFIGFDYRYKEPPDRRESFASQLTFSRRSTRSILGLNNNFTRRRVSLGRDGSLGLGTRLLYKSGPVEIKSKFFAQNFNGKRILYDIETGKIHKYTPEGIEREASDSEKREFLGTGIKLAG